MAAEIVKLVGNELIGKLQQSQVPDGDKNFKKVVIGASVMYDGSGDFGWAVY